MYCFFALVTVSLTTSASNMFYRFAYFNWKSNFYQKLSFLRRSWTNQRNNTLCKKKDEFGFSKTTQLQDEPKNLTNPSTKPCDITTFPLTRKISMCFCQEENEDWVGLSIDHVFIKCEVCLRQELDDNS
jgi:hypothetical protein